MTGENRTVNKKYHVSSKNYKSEKDKPWRYVYILKQTRSTSLDCIPTSCPLRSSSRGCLTDGSKVGMGHCFLCRQAFLVVISVMQKRTNGQNVVLLGPLAMCPTVISAKHSLPEKLGNEIDCFIGHEMLILWCNELLPGLFRVTPQNAIEMRI
jgi:hypothetical protein